MQKSNGNNVAKKITGSTIGPGGWNCPCCGPAPGKSRKEWMRHLKRKIAREAIQFEKIANGE